MNNEKLLENLRCIPDFPQKGVNFRDVTTLFKDPECLKIMVDELYELYKDKCIFASETVCVHFFQCISSHIIISVSARNIKTFYTHTVLLRCKRV